MSKCQQIAHPTKVKSSFLFRLEDFANSDENSSQFYRFNSSKLLKTQGMVVLPYMQLKGYAFVVKKINQNALLVNVVKFTNEEPQYIIRTSLLENNIDNEFKKHTKGMLIASIELIPYKNESTVECFLRNLNPFKNVNNTELLEDMFNHSMELGENLECYKGINAKMDQQIEIYLQARPQEVAIEEPSLSEVNHEQLRVEVDEIIQEIFQENPLYKYCNLL